MNDSHLTSKQKGAYTENKELSQTQLNFLAFCQQFGWGKLEVTIKNGEPTVARIVEQTVKFD